MADRETVIYDIERCICHVPDACIDCSKYGGDNAIRCMEELLADALSLLKAQEPIAPKLIKMYPHDIYECGNCKHRSVGSKDYRAKYCPECGKPVKWNETL